MARPLLTVGTSGPLVQAANLYPTSLTDPNPQVVAHTSVPVSVTAPVRLSAECTCAPGSPEADQFANLAIQVVTPGRIFSGRLDALNVVIAQPVNTLDIRVWLVDNGREQPEGVTTTWSFIAAPATWPA